MFWIMVVYLVKSGTMTYIEFNSKTACTKAVSKLEKTLFEGAGYHNYIYATCVQKDSL
jgi:hypothetical protein